MPLSDHSLVFVGGLHRSGTTPVARLLSAHPQISGFADTGVTEDEGQHLQDVYPAARTHGGAGKFAFSPAAHLTETSPLATPDNAERLFTQWSAHWDLSRPVLLEKSPPNLVMTRFLQALYPSARFLVVVRHPAVVALSTSKWTGLTSLRRLLEHWLLAHEIFLEDAGHLSQVHVLKYEHLVARPDEVLQDVATFLGLEGPIPADTLQAGRSGAYEERWATLNTARQPWRRRRMRALCRDLEPRARRFGYSFQDLADVEDFPAVP